MKTREYTIIVYRDLASYFPEHDWVAVDDRIYGGEPDDKVGRGKTAREAVEDLMDQLDME